MPELPEVEAYRRLAEGVLGSPVRSVVVGDVRFVVGLSPARLGPQIVGRTFVAARRRGKLLILDTEGVTPRLGLRFGMTGRLIVNGVAGVEDLLYSSNRDLSAWDRFALAFDNGGSLVVRDPRLLGSVTVDPDEDALGPDATTLTVAELRAGLGRSAVALKARLMDQSKVAGIGNLLADEILWRAGLAPGRPASSLSPVYERQLAGHVRNTVGLLMARGGSHMGDLVPERRRGGRCPRCAVPLERCSIGGRTSYWCPAHQR
ncbi:MAG: DNA-formamidopyrimidine glycosylase family protein [Acidimicrobiales bacterium]